MAAKPPSLAGPSLDGPFTFACPYAHRAVSWERTNDKTNCLGAFDYPGPAVKEPNRDGHLLDNIARTHWGEAP